MTRYTFTLTATLAADVDGPATTDTDVVAGLTLDEAVARLERQVAIWRELELAVREGSSWATAVSYDARYSVTLNQEVPGTDAARARLIWGAHTHR